MLNVRTLAVFTAVLLLGVSAHALELTGNVALSDLGATAFDNGCFDDYGVARNAACTIDGDPSSYWAGREYSSPQQMWIHFDREYEIAELWIDELDHAFMTAAVIEVLRDDVWMPLLDFFKTVPDFRAEFPEQEAEGLRITIYGVDAPSSWYNRVACLRSVEVAIHLTTPVESTTISAIKSLY